jgi:hypothetical protein
MVIGVAAEMFKQFFSILKRRYFVVVHIGLGIQTQYVWQVVNSRLPD